MYVLLAKNVYLKERKKRKITRCKLCFDYTCKFGVISIKYVIILIILIKMIIIIIIG
jgi:hypothetical protein